MAVSFISLFRDISALMDDVATLGKVATKTTAGVVVDDLVVNSEQASGFSNSREWPIVWKIFVGSILNKVILVPVALIMGHFYPPFMTILLLCGALYLAYEGVEGLHELFKPDEEIKQETAILLDAVHHGKDIMEIEKEKIKGAIITDFVLSAEIIVIAYGAIKSTMPTVGLPTLSIVLAVTAIAITVLVYGLVAMLIKIDDVGLYLRKFKKFESIGQGMVDIMPMIMTTLSWAGVFAMLLVAGGIFVEHSPLHALHEMLKQKGILGSMGNVAISYIVAMIIGKILVMGHHMACSLFSKNQPEH